MPGKHALLSPSAAHRWLTCTPSVRLEQKFPDSESTEAAEGTLAHSLNELLIKRKLRRIKEADFKKELSFIQANELYSDSMLDYCEEFAVYVIEQFHTAKSKTKDAQIFLESEIDLSMYAPESFGTADVVIVADGTLIFIDFKYGKGVPVFADHNPQCMMYALGILDKFGWQYHINNVYILIYQPRIDNTNGWLVDKDVLLQWGNDHLRPKAKMAFDGKGDYAPGDHCKFCRARNRCRANADYYMMEAVEVFTQPPLMSDEEIANILTKVAGLVGWAESVKDHAIQEAVKGKTFPGFKLVAGRSNRKYTNESLVAQTLFEAGYDQSEIYKPQKVKGITEMELQIGKSDFGAHLNNLIVKPYGKPTLVLETDKRPLYDKTKEAADIFSDDANKS